jgi:hypothetical protein
MENPTPSTTLIALNISLLNWQSWNRQLLLKCQSHFGKIGISILRNIQLDILLPPQLTETTPAGRDVYPTDENGDLTDRAFQTFNTNNRRYEQLFDIRCKEDDECLRFILSLLKWSSAYAWAQIIEAVPHSSFSAIIP